jgi:hypothetical protein
MRRRPCNLTQPFRCYQFLLAVSLQHLREVERSAKPIC